MLSAIKELGELIIEREKRELLDVLVENPNSGGYYTKVITIVFEVKDKMMVFSGVELEQYDNYKIMKYLYKSGAANSFDLSPTAKLSGKPEGTFYRKILGWFKILDNRKVELSEDERSFLVAIRDLLEENSTDIKNEILKIREGTPKKEGILVTIKFIQDGNTLYVGDIQLFRRLLIFLANEKDNKLMKKNRVCSICGDVKETVIGKIDTYAFYTLDKPGFITGGFDEQRAWRNFPVCPECKFSLEEGKKFLEGNLTFRFCGIRYHLVPKFIVGTRTVAEEVIDIFTDTSKLASLKQKNMERITNDEEDILDILKDANDVLTLNFLFIQKIQAAERILLVIEDVFPSRLRRIFSAKYSVDALFDQSFTFGVIRNFFAKSDSNKRNYDLDKYFLDIVDRIFKDRPISNTFILSFVMKKIRDEFINDRYFYSTAKDGLQVMTFLEDLDLIKVEVDTLEQRIFDNMFDKYGQMFGTPLKRGLFLLGSLTELLLRKQYKERNAKPFLKNLKSLKMTERDFKGLLPKVQNKLEEYDSFDKGKRQLASEVANYLLMAGDNWAMSVDELNFYFAAGMNLANEVAKVIYPDKNMPEEVFQEQS
ncbi:MAG: TIGR02556 family CRISPR-associated protein [Tepidanaerobacteraceae bacterium]